MGVMQAENLEQRVKAGEICDGMNFHQRVWALVARVPRGRVVTYAQLAGALGTRAYRAVGQAMNRNPYAPQVPCHRVVGSNGRLTGFAGGLAKKRAMLEEEGVEVEGEKVDLERFGVKGFGR